MADVEKSPKAPPESPTPTATPAPGKEASSKHKPGESWKQNEEHVLPQNKLGIVFFGLMSCTFLAALDQVRHYRAFRTNVGVYPALQTIVATALPTIVAKLGGGSEYSWVGRSVILRFKTGYMR